MTLAEALKRVKAAATNGTLVFSRHARVDRSSRASVSEITNALAQASRIANADDPGRFKVTGPSLNPRQNILAVVAIELDVVVITIWRVFR